jgi:hypothetical protein
MRKWQKSLVRVGLGAVLGPVVLSMLMTPTSAQPPSREEVKKTSATKCAESATANQGLEPQAGPFQEELELLVLQVETERTQLRLAESRLEQAKRWESRIRELVSNGRVPIEQLIAVNDSVLMKEVDHVDHMHVALADLLGLRHLRSRDRNRAVSCVGSKAAVPWDEKTEPLIPLLRKGRTARSGCQLSCPSSRKGETGGLRGPSSDTGLMAYASGMPLERPQPTEFRLIV